MKKPIKIYLGDLTYDTLFVSTDAFPLNIGYVASYCIKRFGPDVDVTLFKYIDDLYDAIIDAPPMILGLSNYCWNQNVGLEMFRVLSKVDPYSLKVWGGPNFPVDEESQEIFLKKYHEVDIYIPIEGEIGFSNIVERVMEAESREEVVLKVLSKSIDGCVFRNSKGEVIRRNPGSRIVNLDEIPSPYLNGLMDKFFDGKLTPVIQTNRGCPFKCTYCVDGSDLVRKVNKFSVARVMEEIDYIAKHVPKNTHNLIISDLNFAMFPRDRQICEGIAVAQRMFNYPNRIICSTGKNSKEKIIDAIKVLKGAIYFMIAVQSLDDHVLANIRRDNISVDDMLTLSPVLKNAGLSSKAEVILGLPGESYDSHINTLRHLVRAKMDYILVFSCMLLQGSEMSTPEQRKKWDLKTKFRILPRDFALLRNGKKILEIEEVVISSKTLSLEEYIELRILNFIIFTTNREVVYDPIMRFLGEQNVDIFELFLRMLKKADAAPMVIRKIFDQFRQSTRDELWDSPEQIEAHFQDDNEFSKLMTGEAGINVLYHYYAVVTAEYMADWTDYVLDTALDLIKEQQQVDEKLNKKIIDVANYCRGLSHNPLGVDRMSTNPEFTFEYDIKKWLTDKGGSRLSEFSFSSPATIAFRFTIEQFKIVQDNVNLYGNKIVGISQALNRIPSHALWRQPVLMEAR